MGPFMNGEFNWGSNLSVKVSKYKVSQYTHIKTINLNKIRLNSATLENFLKQFGNLGLYLGFGNIFNQLYQFSIGQIL